MDENWLTVIKSMTSSDDKFDGMFMNMTSQCEGGLQEVRLRT